MRRIFISNLRILQFHATRFLKNLAKSQDSNNATFPQLYCEKVTNFEEKPFQIWGLIESIFSLLFHWKRDFHIEKTEGKREDFGVFIFLFSLSKEMIVAFAVRSAGCFRAIILNVIFNGKIEQSDRHNLRSKSAIH